MRGCTVALAVAVACLSKGVAHAQAPLAVKGTVVRETLDGSRAVVGEQVTLHRVNSRDAGPVDSMRTDARGAFAFRVAVPDTLSMYLVSARFGGIAYFSQPVQGDSPGATALVTVFDTTSADLRLQLQGRHVVVSSPNADGLRSVIDVLEIANDTILTRVPGPTNRPTFSLLLPDGAESVRATQGDISNEAVEVRDGRAELFAPLSPGLRQLVLTYNLRDGAFPVAMPLERPVTVLEVLLEEPGATATSPGLVSQGPVTVDGKTFSRFLGEAAAANAVLTLTGARRGIGSSMPPWMLPLVLTLVTLGAILVLARARSGRPQARRVPDARTAAPAGKMAVASITPWTPTPSTGVPVAPEPIGESRDGRALTTAPNDAALHMAHRLAAVDALLERVPRQPDAVRVELSAYRARLKDELVGVLARGTVDR
ncbi:MAG: hypothetical protein IT360_24510 [Gemmatimonadaceae bacterium]|nr:hypothetical protein [Gemmatimonadaceae bacterium]